MYIRIYICRILQTPLSRATYVSALKSLAVIQPDTSTLRHDLRIYKVQELQLEGL